MDFHEFRVSEVTDVCGRNDAPKETFARSQLVAISSIFIDFRRFHEIASISGVGGFVACAAVSGRSLAPKESFTRFQLAAISSIFIDFRRFHEISWISYISWIYMYFEGFHETS